MGMAPMQPRIGYTASSPTIPVGTIYNQNTGKTAPSVLGNSTVKAPSGGGGIPGGNNANPAPQQNNSQPQQNSQPSLPSLDDIWNPVISALNGMKDTLNSTADQQRSGVDTTYGGRQKVIGDQIGQLNTQLGTDRSTFGNQITSALSQAMKDYNQLQQRNLSLYGGGSSLGPAMNALLTNQYYATQGDINNTGLQGNQQFDQQGQQINQWGDDQNNKLDTWKSEAYQSIQSLLQQGLGQINQDVAMSESQKAQAKQDLLSQVINHRQQIDSYDAQLRNQLTLSQAQNPYSQYNSGNYQQIMQGLNGQIDPALQNLTAMAKSAGMSPQDAQSYVYSLGTGLNPNRTDQNGENAALNQLMGIQNGFTR